MRSWGDRCERVWRKVQEAGEIQVYTGGFEVCGERVKREVVGR